MKGGARTGVAPAWAALARAGVTVGATVLTCSTAALAHNDGGAGVHHEWPAVALFVGGLVVLGTSVSLDARDAVPPNYADAGVLLGVLAVVASIPLYWL